MGYLHSYAPGHLSRKQSTPPATKKTVRRPGPQPLRFYPPEVRERVLQQMQAAKLQREAELKTSQAGDRAEEEADRVANQVMTAPEAAQNDETSSSAPQISRRPESDEDTAVQRLAKGEEGSAPLSVDVVEQIQQVRGAPGQSLPESERRFFESRFQRDFSNVRIHTGPEAEAAARSVDAKAFTMGRDLVFGRGQYRPGTHEGRRLIAHELTHTVQQGAAHALRRQSGPQGPTPERGHNTSPEQDAQAREVRALLGAAEREYRLILQQFNAPGATPERKQELLKAMNGIGPHLAELNDELAAATTDVDLKRELAMMGGLLVTGLVIPAPEEAVTIPAAALRLLAVLRQYWFPVAATVAIAGLSQSNAAVRLRYGIAQSQAIRLRLPIEIGLLQAVGHLDDAGKKEPQIWGVESPSEVFPEVVEILQGILEWKAFDTGSGSGGRDPDPERPNKLAELVRRARQLLGELLHKHSGSSKRFNQVRWLADFLNRITRSIR